MITNKWFKRDEDLSEIINLRKDIFGVDGKDVFDEFSFNLGIYENGEELVGIGRLSLKENNFFIDYVGVKENYRKKYYGDFILRILIKKASDMGLERVYIKCSSKFEGYLNRLNFELEKEKGEKSIFLWKGDLPNGCCK